MLTLNTFFHSQNFQRCIHILVKIKLFQGFEPQLIFGREKIHGRSSAFNVQRS